jgi:hypothetical protein
MIKKSTLLAFLPFIIFSLPGCTYNVAPIDTTLPQKPLIEKLPITIGTYYDDVFRSYEDVWSLPYPYAISYRITIGAPSVILFNQVFSEMFTEVIWINQLPLLPQAKADIAAVIEPGFVDLTIDTDRKMSWVQVGLTYKITLYDLNGFDIADWTIKGSGASVGVLKSINSAAMVREAAHFAMRDVAAQIMLGFNRNLEVKKWLSGFEITAGN